MCLRDSIPRVKPYTYYISLVHPLRNEPRPCLGFVHYQLRHTTRSLFAHTPPWPHLSRGPVWTDSVNLFFPSTPPLPLWSPSLSLTSSVFLPCVVCSSFCAVASRQLSLLSTQPIPSLLLLLYSLPLFRLGLCAVLVKLFTAEHGAGEREVIDSLFIVHFRLLTVLKPVSSHFQNWVTFSETISELLKKQKRQEKKKKRHYCYQYLNTVCLNTRTLFSFPICICVSYGASTCIIFFLGRNADYLFMPLPLLSFLWFPSHQALIPCSISLASHTPPPGRLAD